MDHGLWRLWPRINDAIEVLAGVGAVTWAFDWMRHLALQIAGSGSLLSADDAARLGTWLVQEDRFVDGRLGVQQSAGYFSLYSPRWRLGIAWSRRAA